MAQTGYTPILIYSSTTASQAPAAANLTNSTLGSELAINITDGKLFYKDNANAVQVIGWKTVPTTAGGTGLTSYTAGDMLYYASGTTLTKLAIGSANKFMTSSGTAPQWANNLTFDGTTMNFSSGTIIQGDLGGATVPNRLAFQTNILNGDSRLSVIPNGTGTLAGLALFTDSTRTTGPFLLIEQRSTETRINSTGFTSGDYKPLTLWAGNAVRFQIGTSGQWGIGGATYGTSGQAFISGGASAAPTWGTLGVAGGGTGVSSASITAFNNITGYTATGATGTTSTNLVFSTSPSITTPTLVGDVTLSTGNITQGTAAKGVNFSANSTAAGKTSTLLNWYEEGTFTPTLTGSSTNPTVTYSIQRGRYTRVGRLVTIECYVSWSAISGGSGNIQVAGFPYTIDPNTGASGGGAISYLDGFTYAASRTAPGLLANANTTTASVMCMGSGNTTQYIPVSSVAAGAIIFTLTYSV